MGLISTFQKGFASVVTTLASPISKVLGKTPTTSEKFLSSTIGKGIANAATLAAPAVALVAAPIVAKAALKTPVKSAAITLAGAGVIKTAGVDKTADVIVSAGKGVVKAGETAGKVLTGEKVTSGNISDVIKTAGIAVGVGGLGVAAGKVAEKVLSTKEAIQQTATLPKETEGSKSLVGEATAPIPSQTTTISTTKKRSKRRQAKKPTQIRQSVRININNSSRASISKKYLNERILVKSW